MSTGLINDALAYIGKNIQKPLYVTYAAVSIQRTHGASVSITAPTISGYTFLVWVMCQTSGWVGACYVAYPTSQSGTVWNATAGTTSTAYGYVNCYALYIRDDLA